MGRWCLNHSGVCVSVFKHLCALVCVSRRDKHVQKIKTKLHYVSRIIIIFLFSTCNSGCFSYPNTDFLKNVLQRNLKVSVHTVFSCGYKITESDKESRNWSALTSSLSVSIYFNNRTFAVVHTFKDKVEDISPFFFGLSISVVTKITWNPLCGHMSLSHTVLPVDGNKAHFLIFILLVFFFNSMEKEKKIFVIWVLCVFAYF